MYLGMLPLGDRRGTRTPDTQIKSLLFCHLNYTLIQSMLRSGRLAPQHLYYITLCVICQQVFRNFFILFFDIPKGYLRNSLDNLPLARSASDNCIGSKANDRTYNTNSNEKNQFTHGIYLTFPYGGSQRRPRRNSMMSTSFGSIASPSVQPLRTFALSSIRMASPSPYPRRTSRTLSALVAPY